MPDLKLTDRYTRSMRKLEDGYIRDLGRLLKASRIRLIEAAQSVPVGSPRLSRIIREESTSFVSSAERLTRSTAEDVADAAGIYIAGVYTLADRLGSEFIVEPRDDMEEVLLAELIAPWLDVVPTWGDSFRSLLIAENTRLSGTPEEGQRDAIEALLSKSLAGGRVSALRRFASTLFTGAGIALWGAGNQGVERGADILLPLPFEALPPESRLQKQATAAIDERTTDCCLRVHGQIRPMGKPFKLTGTPRFRDEIDRPPFHWYCRTASALYLPVFEKVGLSTSLMRRAAIIELEAREQDPKRVEIHPAHATSSRTSIY